MVALGGIRAWLIGRSVGEWYVRGWFGGRKSYESLGVCFCVVIRSVAASRARVICGAIKSGRKKVRSLIGLVLVLLRIWSCTRGHGLFMFDDSIGQL